jgi:dihydroorotase
MLDLLIRGAMVVNSDRSRHFDIAIGQGRIVALLPPGSPASSVATVDATGLIAIPGLVDAHVHLREPGLVHKEGFASGTRAAAAGGVTTVMVMPTDRPVTFTPDDFEAKRELAQDQVFVDFALQAAVGRDPVHIRRLVDLGCVSFEIFLADVADEMLLSNAESFFIALSRIEQVGAIAGVTPGDHDVVVSRTAIARANGPAAANFPPSRPPLSEALGIARACVAAAETGARVHIRQLSCSAGLNVFEGLKSRARLSAEVMPHNLTLDDSELARQGVFAKVAPPLRPRADVDAVIGGLKRGTIDIVATDHAPHLPDEKQAGISDIWKAPGGLPGLQTFLPVMLSLVQDGVIGLQDLVRTSATRPADIFGLPFKGRIEAGADADIVLLDLRQDFEIRNRDQLSKAAYTPFDGRIVKGAPVQIFLRGREIMKDGTVDTMPTGRFLKPAC